MTFASKNSEVTSLLYAVWRGELASSLGSLCKEILQIKQVLKRAYLRKPEVDRYCLVFSFLRNPLKVNKVKRRFFFSRVYFKWVPSWFWKLFHLGDLEKKSNIKRGGRCYKKKIYKKQMYHDWDSKPKLKRGWPFLNTTVLCSLFVRKYRDWSKYGKDLPA